MTGKILIEIGIGEAFDRLSILMIKKAKFKDDAKKIAFIQKAIDTLNAGLASAGVTPGSSQLYVEIFESNLAQWELEDSVRTCVDGDEVRRALSDKINASNHRRSVLKSKIDAMYGSPYSEVKQYGEVTNESS